MLLPSHRRDVMMELILQLSCLARVMLLLHHGMIICSVGYQNSVGVDFAELESQIMYLFQSSGQDMDPPCIKQKT